MRQVSAGERQVSVRGGMRSVEPYREQATPSPPAANEEFGASYVQLLRKWLLQLPIVQHKTQS